jgi:hypothetical protein
MHPPEICEDFPKFDFIFRIPYNKTDLQNTEDPTLPIRQIHNQEEPAHFSPRSLCILKRLEFDGFMEQYDAFALATV